MIDNTKEYILCAAIKRKFPRDCNPYHSGTNDICKIEIGYRHHDIFHRFINEELLEWEQGFYTSKGRYVDRIDAMEIAYKAGQVSKEVAISSKGNYNRLFSEDLY